MKPIKFRAWNRLENKWVTADAILNPILSGDMINFNLHSDYIFSIRQDGIELGQFTGLLDKNGKEIYENDLVREIKTGRIGVVKWDFLSLHNLSNNLSRAEVIGNIYENPELLK